MEGPRVDLVTTYDVKSKHNNLETDKNTPVLSVPSNVPLQKFSDRQKCVCVCWYVFSFNIWVKYWSSSVV